MRILPVVALSALALSVTFAWGCGSSKSGSGFGSSGDDTSGGADGGDGEGGGSSFGSFGGGTTNSLTITPSDAVVFIDTATTPATAGTQTYTVTEVDNGQTNDVSTSSTFTLADPTLGSFAGNVFTSTTSLPAGTKAVTTTVNVSNGSFSGIATLTLVPLKRSGADRDFFFVVPYNQAPTPPNDVLAFSTNIQQVDVAFVMDTTGSMGNEISGLTSALGGTLLSQLQLAIPSVGMAIVSHKDVTDSAFGKGLCGIYSPITTTLATAQSAVTAVQTAGALGGDDEPEGQVSCMDYVLNGKALVCAASDDTTTNGSGACTVGGTLEPAVPNSAAGNYGAVQFRPGAVPVVVEITDAAWHDPSAGITAAKLATDFTAANARFVGLFTNDGTTSPPFESQGNTLSDATNSNLPPAALGAAAGTCPTGVGGANVGVIGGAGADAANCRLNFQFNNSGSLATTFTNSIVQAIKGISTGSVFNVTAQPQNDPTNAGGVDATKFIKSLRAMDEGSAPDGCPAHPAIDTDGDGVKDTFTAVTVGTPVCFQVIPNMNTIVPPTQAAQYFNAFINVLGMPGSVKLDQRTVLFLVPPTDPNVK